MIGASLRMLVCQGSGAGSISADIWVDSVNGNDANTGVSKAQAKQTLGAMLAIVQAGETVGVVGGSQWFEELDFGVLDEITCVWDGTGAPPIINGFDSHPSGWVNDLVLTNLWYKDIAHTGVGAARQTVLRNGELMTRKLSAASANASGSGSYFSANAATASTIRVYINVGGNPNTDGATYEVCSRGYGVFAGGDNFRIEGIVARGAMDNVGPITMQGIGGIARRCVMAFGTKHNSVFGGGLLEDCVLYDNDAPSTSEPASILATAFRNDATGVDVTMRRVLMYTRHEGTSGFYAHTINDPADRFNSIALDQCIVNIAGAGAGPGFEGGPLTYTIDKCCAYGNVTIPFATYGQSYSVSHSYGQGSQDFYTGSQQTTDGVLFSLSQVAIHRNLNGGGQPIVGIQPDVPTTIAHTTLVSNDTFYSYGAGFLSGASGSLTLNASIIIANNALLVPGTSGYLADLNTFVRPAGGGGIGPFGDYHGTSRNLSSALATWRTDTGQDASSVVLTTSPLTGSPANGDFRVDGTILAGSGCNEHWDYNLRQVVAGPPERWPTIPTSLAQAIAYIVDPETWNFYP